MQLRNYQSQALETIYSALQVELNTLLSAPCGSGKTIITSTLIKRLLDEYPSFRILILVDRNILVQQFKEKLLAVAPELFLHIGIVCASVSNIKDHSKRVVIASRQSLINQLNTCEPFQLVIIDEVHLAQVPQDDLEPDQFGTIVNTLRQYNPKTRLLGITASPFRMNQGYIYSDHNAPGCRPYFPELTHKISISELQAQGYLVPLIGKKAVPNGLIERLADVKLVGGEYNLTEISDVMSQGVHIQSAVEAWKEHISDRKKTLVFATTISHAEKLESAFNEAGISAMAIHSELDELTEYARMQALMRGEAKVFVSVAKLTVGLDATDVDAIILARPTQSPALFLQIMGRGARIAPNKKDCFVIDLVGAIDIHGVDLDRLKVRYKKGTDKDGKPVVKECPQCEAEIHPACRVCPECDYEYPKTDFEEADKPELVDTIFGSEPPRELAVEGMYPGVHRAKETGKKLLRLRLEMEGSVSGSLWLCFPEDGYSGFAVEKGKGLWKKLTLGNEDYPRSAEAAFERSGEICQPDKVTVDMNGRWPEIKEVVCEAIPF